MPEIGTVVYGIRYNGDYYELDELKIRTSEDDWFVGLNTKTKQAHYFHARDLGKTVFLDKDKAVAELDNKAVFLK